MAVFIGQNDDNLLVGTNGNDQIFGLGGNDFLDGGFGFDLIDGGEGSDTTTYAFFSRGINANLKTGIVSFPGNSTDVDTLISIENLIGSQGNDIITGDDGDNNLSGGAGDDILDGGFGFDQLDGGDGIDTVTYDFYSGGILADLQTGVVSFPGNSTRTETLISIENLIGSRGNDVISGNDSNNVLSGNSGDDTLDGRGGNDQLLGGLGNDTYIISDTNDTIVESLNEGIDTVDAAIDYTLGANLENLTLTGNAVNGTGNALNNVIRGNAGINVLNGKEGDDTLIGGLGNDIYIVNDAGDQVIEAVNEGVDTVFASVSYSLTANIENLVLTETSSLNGAGNELDNLIVGNGGVNTLDGAAGDDTLVGAAGRDLLKGGLGADKFVFAASTDGADQIADFSRAEGDKLVLVASGFNGLNLGQLNASQFVRGKQAKDGNDRLIYNKKQGKLFYDQDGRGSAAKIQLASFDNKPTLGAADFLIVAAPF